MSIKIDSRIFDSGFAARNRVERFIDNRYDDELMSKRFIEWHFTDETI